MKILMRGLVSVVTCSLLFCVGGALAIPVSEEQASNAVLRAVAIHYPATATTPRAFSTRFGYSRRAVGRVEQLTRTGNVVGYVVNLAPSGYYLASTDDELPLWKLRSDEGSFANFPPGLIAVLESEMAEDQQALANLRRARQAPNPKFHEEWQASLQTGGTGNGGSGPTPNIAGTYLLSTTWYQNDPYNYYCPVAAGGPAGRAWAGCTACAVAQILRYKSQPNAVVQNHTYNDNSDCCVGRASDSCFGTHSISDAGLGPYDWADMPNSISTSSPLAQQKAIGQLMYHAAVALNSNFEGNDTEACPGDVPSVLRTYFNYTCGDYETKSSYTSALWYNKIAADIDANEPVFYAMWQADLTEGHAVVCDGYQGGNQIHLNLGWGGAWNAWYNIDSVSANSYTWTIHGAVFRITPPTQLPPLLSNPQVTPASGTPSTTFEFLVDYSDPNSLPPLQGSPTLYLSNGSHYPMTLKSGSTYHYTTTLSTGSYSYSFGAVNLLGGAAQTSWYSGPSVYSSGSVPIDITIESLQQVSPDLLLYYSLTSNTGPWTQIPINQIILSPVIVPAGSQVWFQAGVSNANYTYRGWDAYVNGVHIGGNTASGWSVQLGTATELGLEVSYNYTPQSYTISGTALVSNGSQVPGGVNLVLTSSQQTVTNNTSNGNWSFSGVFGGVAVTITPSAAGYEFSPASLIFYDLNGNQSSQVFTANASDDSVPMTQLTNLPPSVTTNAAVTFGWTGQDNVTPTASLQYQYKLDGADAGWSAWSLATSASYTVSNGCYTFWVRAMDQAGNINQAPTNFTFVVNAAPVVLSAVQNNRSVWSSRLTVQMPVGASRPSSNIAILPAYSRLPDADLVPVRIHRADQTAPAGANAIVASQLGLPTLITKTTNGWLATLPDNLSPGQTTNYDIVWGKVKYFGWQEDVPIAANFPDGGSIVNSYLDDGLNLWRLATKNVSNGSIGNGKAWAYMNIGNSNGMSVNETLLRYAPGHPTQDPIAYQYYYELGGAIVKTGPTISLFWSDREDTYDGHSDSYYYRYDVQVCDSFGNFLNSRNDTYYSGFVLVPNLAIQNMLWFMRASETTNLYVSATDYQGIQQVAWTLIDNFSHPQNSSLQNWAMYPIGSGALAIWNRYWVTSSANIRNELDYAICNAQGQITKQRTVLGPVLADNITQDDNYRFQSVLLDNSGRTWISYYHSGGSVTTNYYVVLASDGSLWQGPVQTGSGRFFNYCDRDGLIWTSEGSQFFVLNPDGTTNVPPRVGAWTPNQPCSGIAASVGNDNYRLYDRWSPQLAIANIPQVDLPASMEVYDLNLWSNGLHAANITIQNGTNTIWIQSGQFTGRVAVAVSGAFSAGQNILTLTQNDFLGGQILVTFPYSFNHVITAAGDSYASVSPSGNVVVTNGANGTFIFSPSLYYHIGSVQVDSSTVSTNSPYTFTNVTKDHMIQVISAPDLATNGTPHWWLAQYGLTNTSWDAAALSSPNGNGLATWQDYIAGISPIAPGSRFVIKNLQILPRTNIFVMSWDSVTGRIYQVYTTTNLLPANWTNVFQTTGDGTQQSYTNTVISTNKAFFKLSVQLQTNNPFFTP